MAVYSALVFLYLYDEFVLSVELLVFDCFVFITHILGPVYEGPVWALIFSS